jgi:hypothetical protein
VYDDVVTVSDGLTQAREYIGVELDSVYQATRSARKVVRNPRPGPISSTTSSSVTPEATILAVLGSLRKCCPKRFFGGPFSDNETYTSSGRPKRLRALRVVRVASSSSSTPSLSATKLAVYTTFSGAFLVPRTGWGLR